MDGPNVARLRIVGVVGTSHYSGLRQDPEAIVYVPVEPAEAFTIYAKSELDFASLNRTVTNEASRLLPRFRIADATTLQALVGDTIVREKLLAGLAGAFAGLGLLMTAVGLFGLLNYSVTRRTKELGIRTALGADRSAIWGLVLGDLSAPLVAGFAAGFLAAVGLLSVLRSLLFGMNPADPGTLAFSLALLGVTALLAAAIPARRAATVDPAITLRYE